MFWVSRRKEGCLFPAIAVFVAAAGAAGAPASALRWCSGAGAVGAAAAVDVVVVIIFVGAGWCLWPWWEVVLVASAWQSSAVLLMGPLSPTGGNVVFGVCLVLAAEHLARNRTIRIAPYASGSRPAPSSRPPSSPCRHDQHERPSLRMTASSPPV